MQISKIKLVPISFKDWQICPKTEPAACSDSFSILTELDRVNRVNETLEVLIVGDSMARYLGKTLCKKERKLRIRVCLSGAYVKDVSEI